MLKTGAQRRFEVGVSAMPSTELDSPESQRGGTPSYALLCSLPAFVALAEKRARDLLRNQRILQNLTPRFWAGFGESGVSPESDLQNTLVNEDGTESGTGT